MKKRDIATSSIGTVTGTATVIGGKTAAMGIATTFGTASTGTAISSLSGVAATNAATAWLGGGALVAGGGGMAAGTVVLTTIPIVGGVVAVGAIGYGAYKYVKGKKKKSLTQNNVSKKSKSSNKIGFQAIKNLFK